MKENTLYRGDNLQVLRGAIPDRAIDLIYLDPPFRSQADYRRLSTGKTGSRSPRLVGFDDIWRWDSASEQAYSEFQTKGPERPVRAIRALRLILGETDLLAYLVMMAPRLVELHRVLKDSGSLYLHCDPSAGHYLKVLLDAVFGAENFRNEIVWRRAGAHNKLRRFGPIHDTIFFYVKRLEDYQWNDLKRPYMNGHLESYCIGGPDGPKTAYYGNVLTGSGVRRGESGKPWQGFDPTPKQRHWAVPRALLAEIPLDWSRLTQHQKLDRLFELGYIKIVPGQAWPIYERVLKPGDGQPVPDIWAFQPHTSGTVDGGNEGIDEDIRWLSPQDRERVGYPTQKPEGLLRRIIAASSRVGELVLDPFCGSGTTLAAARQLGRRWIGIDASREAIEIARTRLQNGERIGSIEPCEAKVVDVECLPVANARPNARSAKATEAHKAKPDSRQKRRHRKQGILRQEC
jgi:site-specific DNA-methyltransferase (adenine-specific)